QSAAVAVREDTQGDRRLVAYVVPKHDISNDELQRHLEKSLPAYMVPSAILQLDTMPLTPSGKIDRKALPTPAFSDIERGQGHEYVAPTSIEHFQLLQIWEELLDARPIGIRDNFFRLGGHSLLAARLSLRIEQVFGKKIALNTLFASPTIEELANALSQDSIEREQASVTVIQVGKKQRPFFFLHGDWTGGPFYCFTLAHAFGPEQPFYAINTYNFNGPSFPLTLEEIAAAHLKAMRAIQPEGPYLFGGFCNGGLIAYEMARQLHAAGQESDLLLLVAPVRITWPYKAFHRCMQSLGKLMGLKKRQQLDLFLRTRHMIRHLYRQAQPGNDKTQDFDKLLAIDPRLSRFSPPREALYNDYVGVFSWLSTPYTFGFYPKNASFIWAEKEMAIWSDWFDIASHKETSMMPGTHMACVTDHIDLLATLMSTSLKKVQEK
ncbi:MAG TPA: thioesterase domain-containing protein, partial [Ktedonobacteraceae bacterium]|nr:thioesterase domain-containing protein [Ktedonobacteraceae bacterium]